jgi:DNA-binding MurR/RpiR family transcriptional regulator
MDGSMAERLEARRSGLSPRIRRVAEYLVDRPEFAATASASEIAEAAGVSDATVVRTVQLLGYNGLPDLRRSIARELEVRNPRDAFAERVGRIGGETTSALDKVLLNDIELLVQARATISSEAFGAAVEILGQAERVVIVGFGTPGMLAEMTALAFNRIAKRAHALTASGFRLADGLVGLSRGDAVLLLAPQRYLPEIDVLLDHTAAIGIPVVLVTEVLRGRLSGRVGETLVLPSTRGWSSTGGAVLVSVLEAVTLAVAATDPAAGTNSWETINRLRVRLAGPELDFPTSLSSEPSNAQQA